MTKDPYRSAGVAKSSRRAWPGARSGQSPANSSTATAAVGNLQPRRPGARRRRPELRPGGRPVPRWPGCARSASAARHVPGSSRPGRAGSARWPRTPAARTSPTATRRVPAHQLPGLPGPARGRADHGVRQVAVAAQPTPDAGGVAPPALGQRPVWSGTSGQSDLACRSRISRRGGVSLAIRPPCWCLRRRPDEHEVDRGGPHHRPAVLVHRLDQGLDDAAVRLAERSARLDRPWPGHGACRLVAPDRASGSRRGPRCRGSPPRTGSSRRAAASPEPAVCQPLAISPPKGPVAAATGST